MKDSFKALLASRKFLTLLLSTVTSLVLLVIGQAAPQFQDVTNTVVEIITPLALAVIAGITIEDSASKFLASRAPKA